MNSIKQSPQAPVDCALEPQRRKFLHRIVGSAAAMVIPGAIVGPRLAMAQSAKFRYRCGISLPDSHPTVMGMKAAVAEILQKSGGVLDIQIFANGQLGGDLSVISQLRQGAVEMFSTAGSVWQSLMPNAGIPGLAFAFTNTDTAFAAVDGDLGTYIRSQFSTVNLQPMSKLWNHGFRHITTAVKPIQSPQDIVGMKIRVPQTPLATTLFTALGAGPSTIPFAEVYSALQTRVVDGQENPLPLIETAKLYEVQKFCALTGHQWDGFWIASNKRAWEALPADLRDLTQKTFDAHALKTRIVLASVEEKAIANLKADGMTFNNVDSAPFRQVLQKAGFYTDWQKKFAPEAWKALEKYSGKLA
jgi:tripartite ATP-independent transporter DctP family solute receptor